MRVPADDAIGWLDGVPTAVAAIGIAITDPETLVGLGVFETLALRDGRVLDLRRHLERLEAGASALAVPLPGRDKLVGTVGEAARHERASCAWLKILATRGGRWVVLTGGMDPTEEGRGVSAVVLPWRRDRRHPLARVKATSYAANQLGLEWAAVRGAQEGLWLNDRGHLAEGCASNLFVVRHRGIHTPGSGEGILPGVVRVLAIEAARKLGIAVHETRLRVEGLRHGREAFLTSSLCGVRPLLTLDGVPIGNGRPGPLTRAIADRVRELREVGTDGGTLGDRAE